MVKLFPLAGVALAIALGSLPATARATPPTFVGSGRLGFEDGPATRASFVAPLGVTEDGGTLLVADSGAQRIRRVLADGTVVTVAGSGALDALGLGVPGGYRDGPARSARFDHPTATAIDRDRSILVSDTRNHCIRRIRLGQVSTYAGSPERTMAADGSPATAAFFQPRDLALGADGSVYVADHGAGLRRIDATGTVTTIDVPVIGARVTAMALFVSGGHQMVLETNGWQTVQFDMVDRSWRVWSINRLDKNLQGVSATLEGGLATGYPAAFAVYGDDEFVYVDAERNDAHYIDVDATSTIPTADALLEPDGIAIRRNGSLAIASTASRRIVLLPGVDRRSFHIPSEIPPPKASGTYRIAYVGNSHIYYDTSWQDSIPGTLEARLNRDAGSIGLTKRIEVYPVRFGPLDGVADYAREILTSGLFDAVVLQLNTANIYTSYGVTPWTPLNESEATWRPKFLSDLTTIVDELRGAQVPLAIVIHPVAADLGPNEAVADLEINRGNGIATGTFARSVEEIPTVVNSLHVACTLDATSDFVAAEKTANHRPLFGSNDWHLASAGRHIVASDAISLLERCHPWRGNGS